MLAAAPVPGGDLRRGCRSSLVCVQGERGLGCLPIHIPLAARWSQPPLAILSPRPRVLRGFHLPWGMGGATRRGAPLQGPSCGGGWVGWGGRKGNGEGGGAVLPQPMAAVLPCACCSGFQHHGVPAPRGSSASAGDDDETPLSCAYCNDLSGHWWWAQSHHRARSTASISLPTAMGPEGQEMEETEGGKLVLL